MVKRGGPFGGFHDGEEADVTGGSGQAIASAGPVGGYQQPFGTSPARIRVKVL